MMTVVLFGTALTTIWSGERRRAALTRIFGLELGEVDVGVEHWADGGQLAQRLVLLPLHDVLLVPRHVFRLAVRSQHGGARLRLPATRRRRGRRRLIPQRINLLIFKS